MMYAMHSLKKIVLRISAKPFLQISVTLTKLAEVGKLEVIDQQGKYKPGQLFIHKVFAYRGVVLFPWIARVYNRDLVVNKKEINAERDDSSINWKTQMFYQVLIDSRDWQFIRAHTESVTYMKKEGSSRGLYAIPGLDYVAHDDLIPYTSAEKKPIQHQLFDKFFVYSAGEEPSFHIQEALKVWQKNHDSLENSEVHKETTENICVTAVPFYIGRSCHNNSTLYWWRYMIRLENFSNKTVRLCERHWRIFSHSGVLETVRGRGISGQELLLSKALPAFQYSSHVSLQAPSGHMWGTFRLQTKDKQVFDCRIPAFSLESSNADMSSPLDALSGIPKNP